MMRTQRLLQSTAIALALGLLTAAPSVAQDNQQGQADKGQVQQQQRSDQQSAGPQGARAGQQAGQQGAQQRAGQQKAQQAAGGQQQRGDQAPVIVLRDWNYDRIYGEGWSVRELMDDATVYGPGGDDIGSVENVIISQDGKVLGLVAQVGGFVDLFDTHVFVPWDQVNASAGFEQITIPVTEENVERYSTWPDGYITKAETGRTQVVDDDLQTGFRTWKATELLGDDAFLTDDVGYGLVDDLIFLSDGSLHAVVISANAGFGGGYYAYPYYGYRYGWAPGYPSYYTGYGRSDIASLEPFDYDKMNQNMAKDATATTGAASQSQTGTTPQSQTGATPQSGQGGSSQESKGPVHARYGKVIRGEVWPQTDSENKAGASAQASAGQKPETASANQASADFSQLVLSDQQQKALFDAASGWQAQNLPTKPAGSPILAGAEVPSSIELKAMPDELKQRFGRDGKLKDVKLAKIKGNYVIVVDPDSRRVQAVITRKEASQQTGTTTGAAVGGGSAGGAADNGPSGQQQNRK